MDLRRIDALVAEKVMGWDVVDCGGYLAFDTGSPTQQFRIDSSWSPSSDISAAWEVVERLGGQLPMGIGVYRFGGRWECSLDAEGLYARESADTPALAICLAALKAKGVDL